MNKEQLEKLGQLIDKLDNINEATKIPISSELHLAGLKDAIPNIRKEVFDIYTALGGEDAWSDPPSLVDTSIWSGGR